MSLLKGWTWKGWSVEGSLGEGEARGLLLLLRHEVQKWPCHRESNPRQKASPCGIQCKTPLAAHNDAMLPHVVYMNYSQPASRPERFPVPMGSDTVPHNTLLSSLGLRCRRHPWARAGPSPLPPTYFLATNSRYIHGAPGPHLQRGRVHPNTAPLGHCTPDVPGRGPSWREPPAAAHTARVPALFHAAIQHNDTFQTAGLRLREVSTMIAHRGRATRARPTFAHPPHGRIRRPHSSSCASPPTKLHCTCASRERERICPCAAEGKVEVSHSDRVAPRCTALPCAALRCPRELHLRHPIWYAAAIRGKMQRCGPCNSTECRDVTTPTTSSTRSRCNK